MLRGKEERIAKREKQGHYRRLQRKASALQRLEMVQKGSSGDIRRVKNVPRKHTVQGKLCRKSKNKSRLENPLVGTLEALEQMPREEKESLKRSMRMEKNANANYERVLNNVARVKTPGTAPGYKKKQRPIDIALFASLSFINPAAIPSIAMHHFQVI